MIKIGSLFAGIGGFELGLERAWTNATTVWQVEIEPFNQRVLAKHWPNAKLHNDVRAVGSHNLAPVHVICAGFPCQNASVANQLTRDGINGNKTGLWREILRIVGELRPRIVVLENVPNIVNTGATTIIGEFAHIGYCIEWGIVSAAQCGAPHKRSRWFAVAYTDRPNVQKQSINAGGMAATHRSQRRICEISGPGQTNVYWERVPHPPGIYRVDDGLPDRLYKRRIKALGNAIVPQCSEWIGQRIMAAGLLDDLLT